MTLKENKVSLFCKNICFSSLQDGNKTKGRAVSLSVCHLLAAVGPVLL